MRTDPLLQGALNRETLSMVVFGASKTGKSTLASTSPLPILCMDAEGGSKFLPVRKIVWDPRQPPPVPDGTWDMAVVAVNDWEVVALAHQWLASGQHGFASVVMDSLTEMQRRCKRNIGGADAFQQQAWGKLLVRMEDVVTQFRDLTEHPVNPVSTVTFICESVHLDDKWRPSLQGALRTALPYKVDLCAFLFVADVADALDPTLVKKQRQLLTGPDPTIESGERVQGRLPHIVVEPNMTEMLNAIFPSAT